MAAPSVIVGAMATTSSPYRAVRRAYCTIAGADGAICTPAATSVARSSVRSAPYASHPTALCPSRRRHRPHRPHLDGTPYHHQAYQRRRHRLPRPRPRHLARTLRHEPEAAAGLHTRLGRSLGPRNTARCRPPPPRSQIAIEDLLPGDVLVFRYRANNPAKHVAILDRPRPHGPRHRRHARLRTRLHPGGRAGSSPRSRFPKPIVRS